MKFSFYSFLLLLGILISCQYSATEGVENNMHDSGHDEHSMMGMK